MNDFNFGDTIKYWVVQYPEPDLTWSRRPSDRSCAGRLVPPRVQTRPTARADSSLRACRLVPQRVRRLVPPRMLRFPPRVQTFHSSRAAASRRTCGGRSWWRLRISRGTAAYLPDSFCSNHSSIILPPHYHHITITITFPPHYHHIAITLPSHYHHTIITLPSHYQNITTLYHHITTTLPSHYHHITTTITPTLPSHYHHITTILRSVIIDGS